MTVSARAIQPIYNLYLGTTKGEKRYIQPRSGTEECSECRRMTRALRLRNEGSRQRVKNIEIVADKNEARNYYTWEPPSRAHARSVPYRYCWRAGFARDVPAAKRAVSAQLGFHEARQSNLSPLHAYCRTVYSGTPL